MAKKIPKEKSLLENLTEEELLVITGEVILSLVERGITTMTLTTVDDSVVKVYMIPEENS